MKIEREASKKIATLQDWAKSNGKRGNTKKGDAFEDKVEDFLKRHGWIVERTKMNRRMIYRGGRSAWITIKADFFGCIDIIGVNTVLKQTIFVQATTARALVKQKAAEIDAIIPGNWTSFRVEIWFPSYSLGHFGVFFREVPGRWIETSTRGINYG